MPRVWYQGGMRVDALERRVAVWLQCGKVTGEALVRGAGQV